MLLRLAAEEPRDLLEKPQSNSASRNGQRKRKALWDDLRLNTVRHEAICPDAGEILRFC